MNAMHVHAVKIIDVIDRIVRGELELDAAPVIDPERATEMEPLHPDRPTMGRRAHGYRDDPRPNVVRSMVIRRGDPETEADVTVEGVYDVGQQDQAFLGPESGIDPRRKVRLERAQAAPIEVASRSERPG